MKRLTPWEALATLDATIRRYGATGARIADDCTACGSHFTTDNPPGDLELAGLENGHRILYFVCVPCYRQMLTDPRTVAGKIEARLVKDLEAHDHAQASGGIQA